MAISLWRTKPVWIPVDDKKNPKGPEFLTGGQLGGVLVSYYIHELPKDAEPKDHLNHPTFLAPACSGA